jgi:hypothetical protein
MASDQETCFTVKRNGCIFIGWVVYSNPSCGNWSQRTLERLEYQLNISLETTLCKDLGPCCRRQNMQNQRHYVPKERIYGHGSQKMEAEVLTLPSL